MAELIFGIIAVVSLFLISLGFYFKLGGFNNQINTIRGDFNDQIKRIDGDIGRHTQQVSQKFEQIEDKIRKFEKADDDKSFNK